MLGPGDVESVWNVGCCVTPRASRSPHLCGRYLPSCSKSHAVAACASAVVPGTVGAVRHDACVPRAKTAPPSYLARLLAELDAIEQQYLAVLDQSSIRNVDPNRSGSSGILYVGVSRWGWVASAPVLEAQRMDLLARVRDWGPRYRLLFPHPTPQVSGRLDKSLGLLERWLLRKGRDRSIPPTIDQARQKVTDDIQSLRDLGALLPTCEHPVRIVTDTNVLIDYADVSIYTGELGARYRVHLLPVVLREIDDLKRSGRTQELRDAAKRADRYLKELRRRGDLQAGVKVAGDVTAVFEYAEPKADGLPNWLDLDVPDDRLVASVLLLQSAHPGAVVYVSTSDLNLQNKLGAVGLPHVEPPE